MDIRDVKGARSLEGSLTEAEKVAIRMFNQQQAERWSAGRPNQIPQRHIPSPKNTRIFPGNNLWATDSFDQTNPSPRREGKKQKIII